MSEEDVDNEFDQELSVEPIELKEHTIDNSELEYIEKEAESVYHWFYPPKVNQDRAKEIAEETFAIPDPEVYKEDMFESITVILSYIDNKDHEERHEALVAKCG